jgi:hypothetical protein
MSITIVLGLISGSRLHPYSRFYDKFFYYFYAIVSVLLLEEQLALDFSGELTKKRGFSPLKKKQNG